MSWFSRAWVAWRSSIAWLWFCLALLIFVRKIFEACHNSFLNMPVPPGKNLGLLVCSIPKTPGGIVLCAFRVPGGQVRLIFVGVFLQLSSFFEDMAARAAFKSSVGMSLYSSFRLLMFSVDISDKPK